MNKFNILPSQKGNLFLETKTHMLYTCDGFVIDTGKKFDNLADTLLVSQNIAVCATNGFEFNCVVYGIGVSNLSFIGSELELYLVKFKENDTKLHFQTFNEVIDWFYGKCNDPREWQIFTPFGTMLDGTDYMTYREQTDLDVYSIYQGELFGTGWDDTYNKSYEVSADIIDILKTDKLIELVMTETHPDTGKLLKTYRKNKTNER